jgi:hypothetical protein
MSKRLLKLHKRKVARAKVQVRLSEPDLRSPEQIREARDASRPAGGWRNGSAAQYSSPSVRTQGGPSADSRAKGDG